MFDLARDAEISECGRYRYLLRRQLTVSSAERWCTFVMLNPSTADGTVDDPTVRRCTGFARAWGHDWLYVVNLFAYRATSPIDMMDQDDPVGPANDHALRRVINNSDCVVCAWGKHGRYRDRAKQFLQQFPCRAFHVLALNKDGSPKHPLYVRGDAVVQAWNP